MIGIIFNTEQEFTQWNVNVTNAMKSQGQIMEIWCNPILSKEETPRYFGSTGVIGIRRTIMEPFLIGYDEVEILSTDPTWFEQKPFPNELI